MDPVIPSSSIYLGLFERQDVEGGRPRMMRHRTPPAYVPDPETGRHLRVATIQGDTRAICPSCSTLAQGGFVSFESDLRLVYACPECRKLVWLKGA